MDIGSLTGQVAIEDQLSDHLTSMLAHVRDFAENFDGAFGAMAIGVGVATAAIVGAAISIVELGEKGSTVLDVEASFDRLAEAAGTTGDVLRGNLSEGVKGTIGDFELMETTSRLMTSGIKLSGDQAKLMGEAARALGKATGGDAASGLSLLSNALTTGRVRGLQMAGVTVDLKASEEAYAKSLGGTASELTREGKLHADQIAIFTALQAKVEQLGVSQLSFKERMQQATVAVEEWGINLAKAVASSPHVTAALDAIQGALVKAFGGDSSSLLNTIVGWINSFADAVARYGPPIIQTIADIAHGIFEVWEKVKTAWNDVPDWFKNIATDAALASGAVYLTSGAFKAVSPDILGASANVASLIQGFESLTTLLKGNFLAAIGTVMIKIEALWDLMLAFPAVSIAAGIGVVTVALTAWYERSQDQKLQQQIIGAQQDTINKAIRDGAEATINYADAVAYNNANHVTFNQRLKETGVIVGTTMAQIVAGEKAAAVATREHEQAQLNDAAATKAAIKAEEEHRASLDKTLDITARLYGGDAIKKAEDFMKANIDITRLDSEGIKEVVDVMSGAIDAFIRKAVSSHTPIDELADKFETIRQRALEFGRGAVSAFAGADAAAKALAKDMGELADLQAKALGPALNWSSAGPAASAIPPRGFFQNAFSERGVNPSARALGGSVSAGQPYRVGELEPELFVPSQSGVIVPGSGGGGGGNMHNTFYISGSDPEVVANKVIDKLERQAQLSRKWKAF